MCIGVTCPSPGRPSHGETTPRLYVYDYRVTATFICHTGYSLVGHNNTVCTNQGLWQPDTAPSCQCKLYSNTIGILSHCISTKGWPIIYLCTVCWIGMNYFFKPLVYITKRTFPIGQCLGINPKVFSLKWIWQYIHMYYKL